ncbi:MAG: hypothetical protein D6692_12750 [Planctomycetota bacterium]|nr:MAG: hypothetical protein D6692_12750 [Planctomycetota bacterium]
MIGCDRGGIEEHAVSKGVERMPASEGVANPVDVGADEAARSDRPWIVPAGWTEDPEPRQMRLATYIAPDPSGPVEVAVSRFGGRVGGDLANINRWRGQMGLPAIEEAELDAAIARFSAPGFDGYETRIEAPSGVMLAAGVYDEAIGQMWFVRATVPDAAVADRLQADVFSIARSIAGLGDVGDD